MVRIGVEIHIFRHDVFWVYSGHKLGISQIHPPERLVTHLDLRQGYIVQGIPRNMSKRCHGLLSLVGFVELCGLRSMGSRSLMIVITHTLGHVSVPTKLLVSFSFGLTQ